MYNEVPELAFRNVAPLRFTEASGSMRSSNERPRARSSRAPASITRSPKTGAAAHLRIGASILMTLVIARSFAACVDPVHDAQITALGRKRPASHRANSIAPGSRAPFAIKHRALRNTSLRSPGTIFYGPIKSLARRGSSRAGRFGRHLFHGNDQLRRQLLYPAGYLESRIPAPRPSSISGARQRSDQDARANKP